jgi:hypothetical protein
MDTHSDSENNDGKINDYKEETKRKSVTYCEQDSGCMFYDPYGAFQVPCNSPNSSPEIKAESKMVDRDLLKESLVNSFFLDYIRDEEASDGYFSNPLKNSIVSEDEVFGKLTIDTGLIDKENDSDNESVYPVRDVEVDPRYTTFDNLAKDIYKKPPKSSKAARTIWKQAGLGDEATLYQIELHLVDWAQKYAKIYEDNFKITHITWKCTKRDMTLQTSWLVFIKWVLCGCLTDLEL